MKRFSDFALEHDLAYRFLALIPIILGFSIFASLPVLDTTIAWADTNYGVSREFFALVSIVCGIRLMWRRVTRYDFVLLYLPVWLYQVALIGFVVATYRSSTIPALMIGFDLIVLAVIRWGIKPL